MADRTPNPYDRRTKDTARGREQLNPDVAFGDAYAPFDILADGRRAYPGFTVARLEELLRDEYARGFNCGEGTTEAKYDDEVLPKVKRHVWLEGHIAGWKDGRAQILVAIAGQWENPTHEVIAAIDSVLGEGRVTKATLAESLGAARTLLAQLVDAHHKAFTPEPPF